MMAEELQSGHLSPRKGVDPPMAKNTAGLKNVTAVTTPFPPNQPIPTPNQYLPLAKFLPQGESAPESRRYVHVCATGGTEHSSLVLISPTYLHERAQFFNLHCLSRLNRLIPISWQPINSDGVLSGSKKMP